MSLPHPLPIVPTTDEIVPAIQRIIAQRNGVRQKILDTITPSTATFDTVMRPLAEVENAVQGELGMIYMLQYGSPSFATQEAFNKARKLYVEAEASWTADGAFFKLLRAARDKPEIEMLDPESKHLLERELLEYKHAGHGVLDASELDAYSRENMAIKDLEMKFQQNIARENGGVWFTLEELDGLPVEELEKWRDGPEDGLQLENGESKKFVPFANGGTLAVLTYARRPETRKRMFLADNMKLAENKPLFEEIVKRRAAQAHRMKYPTHADFRIERRMVKTTEWLEGFLGQIRKTLCPRGKEEIEVLQRRRLNGLGENGETGEQKFQKFYPWDKRYYERLMEQEFDVDHAKISEFFPLEQTATGMLGIFASLLHLRFDPIPTESLPDNVIWHDTVRVFSVWDGKDGGFIGYLYFDLLWRENKYRGNQSVNIQCGYLRPDGTRQHPATILMCSFPTPTPASCALLKQHQVVTLFHEMGHGIHDLLAKTRYVRFHGYHLPPDFGEMPSVMLENWCWMKDVLKGLSCHYTTVNDDYLAAWRKQHPGEPDPPKKIPEELVDRLVKHRYFNQGLYYLRILSISIFDMQIHSLRTEEQIANLDVQKLWYDILEETEGMDITECRDGFAFGTFTHLTAGYDVCYYAYLCCTAMAQDLFLTVFANDPYNKESWERYRRGILEQGGSQSDLLQMLEDCLGRAPNMNALVEGLARG
ncbi:M3 family metallopeptidase [Aspergillus ibericus CBS 121593]|uniref:Peptidase family M3 n=1 Tax=Aspergillus ibericus CBS 121593 TaxID=1448316 RepID=A0A395H1P0_9EURO|nr:peptidase family M3 [Aspergillus ibericus CBS 121593]RAL00758.1 peptidase family M3 [Aspergillus ibericus CBS 121593]